MRGSPHEYWVFRTMSLSINDLPHIKRTTFFGVRRTSKNFIPDLELLLEWLRSGKISVPLKAAFKLEEIQKAHREYASSARMGSIVIEISR
jgi:hypothetical protein